MKLENLARSLEIFRYSTENDGFSFVVGDGAVFGPNVPEPEAHESDELFSLGWYWDDYYECWAFY